MDVLRQFIVFEKKEQRADGSLSVSFKFSTAKQDFRLMAFSFEDGIVLVQVGEIQPSAPVISFNKDGKVFVYNPSPVLTAMAEVLAEKVQKIASNNAQRIAKISEFKDMEQDVRKGTIDLLVPFLFLCNAKANTAKALALNLEASRNSLYQETLKPIQERIQHSWVSKKQTTRFASYLLKKLDPQRDGLKSLLNTLFKE
jgi:hypothetical protein